MCFYLALKVYILYSFFCTTSSRPGRPGSGCPRCWQGCGLGEQLGSTLPRTARVAGAGRAAQGHRKAAPVLADPCPQEPLAAHSDGAILGDLPWVLRFLRALGLGMDPAPREHRGG